MPYSGGGTVSNNKTDCGKADVSAAKRKNL